MAKKRRTTYHESTARQQYATKHIREGMTGGLEPRPPRRLHHEAGPVERTIYDQQRLPTARDWCTTYHDTTARREEATGGFEHRPYGRGSACTRRQWDPFAGRRRSSRRDSRCDFVDAFITDTRARRSARHEDSDGRTHDVPRRGNGTLANVFAKSLYVLSSTLSRLKSDL